MLISLIYLISLVFLFSLYIITLVTVVYIMNCIANVVKHENVAPLIPRFKTLTNVIDPAKATIIYNK